VTAETMFRHDRKALLYAPLRIVLHEDAEGKAILTLDQPSTAFGSLGIDQITAVGKELDRTMAALLRLIGVEASRAFCATK
jgi:uncharacterized protein (DUF302 family)